MNESATCNSLCRPGSVTSWIWICDLRCGDAAPPRWAATAAGGRSKTANCSVLFDGSRGTIATSDGLRSRVTAFMELHELGSVIHACNARNARNLSASSLQGPRLYLESRRVPLEGPTAGAQSRSKRMLASLVAVVGSAPLHDFASAHVSVRPVISLRTRIASCRATRFFASNTTMYYCAGASRGEETLV